jgi:glycosyltransferase involved in cell wall biosynthesis
VFALRQEPRPATWPLLGATVHNIGARPRLPRMVAAILAEHRRAPFDVLHAYWAAPQGALAAFVSQRTGAPVLLHINGGDLSSLRDIRFGGMRTRRGRVALRYAVKHAAAITVSSTPMQERAARLGIIAELLPFGVALDQWPPRKPRPGIGSPARLLHVGTLNRVKDQHTLLLALAELRRTRDFAVDIVGEDTLDGEIQALAAKLGLQDVAHFRGYVTHGELRPFFDAADLLVLSSRHEADPIVALEAAVAGLPVAGTAVGLLAQWAPAAARAVPPQNPVALAEAIRALLDAPEERMRMAQRAQAIALAHDADRWAQRVLECYAMLAEK